MWWFRIPGPGTWAAGLVFGAALILSACGFQLRGDIVIPFRDIFITAPSRSPIAAGVVRGLSHNKVPIAGAVTGADAHLLITIDRREKIILSLSGAGRVREFQLQLRVAYQLVDNRGAVLIPSSEVNLTRIMSFDDAFVLAKGKEEALLYQDMDNDVVQQILRRLSLVRRAG